MKLNNLLEDVAYSLLCGDAETEISSVAYDSRKVTDGALFVCIRGFDTDGHKYIESAVRLGAAAILIESPYEFSDAQKEALANVTVVSAEDTRKALAYLSATWFGHPANQMTMIGITGTKGKTTTSHMIKKILEENGDTVGMIGTLGAFIGQEKYPTSNTTPESYELHSLFAKMLEAGCKYVVMEVSSQALKLHRTLGINFQYGVFLNISPDHIGAGEHADFEEYLSCKKLLFDQTEQTIVNSDDSRWQEVTADAKNVYTTSREKEADFKGTDIKNFWGEGCLGVSFHLTGDKSGALAGEYILNLPGSFNVENALIAIAISSLLGIPRDKVASGLRTVSVKGRAQVLPATSHFSTFLIDYAHNALSMESLLSMLREYNPKRLICLFGGGGNRPKIRRHDMGFIAGKYADLTILTTDNPRYESVESINADIIEGLNETHGKYQIILDRKEAIHYLIDNCGSGDIVALIGKGHEEYQDICGKKYFFSEEQIVEEYLQTK